MNAKILSLFALVAFVSAQGTSTTDAAGTTTDSAATPSGTAGGSLPPNTPQCVADCIQQATTSTGCAATDTACLCGDAFGAAAAQCVLANCSADDQAAAISIQSQQCGGGATSVTGSGSVTIQTSTGSAPATSAVTTRASASTPTRPLSSATSGAATSGAATAAATTNAAAPIVAQGAWAMAAGLLGVAVAL